MKTVQVVRRCQGCGQAVVVRLERRHHPTVWCAPCLEARVAAVVEAREGQTRQGGAAS